MVVSETLRFGLEKYVYFGLTLAKDIFNAPIDSSVITQFTPKRLSAAEKIFLNSVIQDSRIFEGSDLLYLSMNESFAQRIYFLWSVLFPPKHELAIIKQKSISDIGLSDYGERFYYAGRDLVFLIKRWNSLKTG